MIVYQLSVQVTTAAPPPSPVILKKEIVTLIKNAVLDWSALCVACPVACGIKQMNVVGDAVILNTSAQMEL